MDRRHFITAALAAPIIATFPSLANAHPTLTLRVIRKISWEGGYHTIVARMHELKQCDKFFFEDEDNIIRVACKDGFLETPNGGTCEQDSEMHYAPKGRGEIQADVWATWNKKRKDWDYNPIWKDM
jgi:hypothetical protein